MTESDPGTLEDLQSRLQEVVFSLRRLEGQPPSEVEPQLREALAAAGVPDQPSPWMRDTSVEIAAGRLVVIGSQEVPEEAQALAPDPDQHAAG